MTGLADLFLRQDQIERSRNMYRSAWHISRTLPTSMEEAVTLIGIGVPFSKENHADSARFTWNPRSRSVPPTAILPAS